jgi:ABC-type polysaccharide transport system permease subunit
MKKGRKLFCISSHSIIRNTLGIALGYEFEVTMVVSKELLQFSLTPKQQAELLETKNTIIILAGFREDVVGQFLWQNLRLTNKLLNPVLVCGYESKVKFTEKHHEFASGAKMYHQYMEMPWQQITLMSLLEDLNATLEDEWHLEGLYRKYGEANLRLRLPSIMHGLQGKNSEKILPLAEHVLFLCETLNDPEILDRIKKIVSELRTGATDNLARLKKEIESIL